MLRWSPCGAYLLAAHPSGDFRIWQTQVGPQPGGRGRARALAVGGLAGQGVPAPCAVRPARVPCRGRLPGSSQPHRWLCRLHSRDPTPPPTLQTWWSQRWAAAEGGDSGSARCALAEACWAPDSRSLLLAYEHSPQARLGGGAGPQEAAALAWEALLPGCCAQTRVCDAGAVAGVVQERAWRGHHLPAVPASHQVCVPRAPPSSVLARLHNPTGKPPSLHPPPLLPAPPAAGVPALHWRAALAAGSAAAAAAGGAQHQG